MTSTLSAPVHFAAEVFAILIALGAALALAREEGRPLVVRAAGSLGFLALAAAEGVHGADLGADDATVVVALRAGGFVLLLGGALLTPRPGLAAAAGGLGRAVSVGVVALAAAAATALRRGRDRASVALAWGLALLGTGELLVGGGSRTVLGAAHVVRVAGYLAIAMFVVSAARRSIRFRIVTGFVSLLLVLVLGVSSALSEVVARNQRGEAFSRVRAQAEAAAGRVLDLGDQEARGLRLLVDQAVKLGRGHRRISTSELREFRRQVLPGIDFIVLMDRAGGVGGQVGIDRGGAFEVAGTEVTREARRTRRAQVAIDALADGRLALLSAVPVRDRGTVVGFAAAGFVVDSALLETVAPVGGRALVFPGEDPRAAAVFGSPRWSAGRELVSGAVLEDVRERFLFGSPVERRTMSIGGVEHFAALVPLSAGGRPVGILVVAEPAAVVAATQREVNRVLLVVTLGLAVLALLLAVVAARRVTRPVLALTKAARRVQQGDLTAKADVASRDEVGDLAATFNQMTDSVVAMTEELKEVASEEARLRARLETVVNSMGEGLIAVDASGHVVTYNPAAAAIVGLPRSSVIGKAVGEILRGRDAEGEALSTEETPTGFFYFSRHDGNEIPVVVSSAPLREGSVADAGRVFVIRDVTSEHEIERMKTEFLSNVSHELRTPLTPIIGYSELMLRRDVPGHKSKEFAHGILDSAHRLERIVGMLVDFSAMEAGRMSVAAEPVKMRPMVLGAVDDWRDRTTRHRFVIRIPPELPAASADPSLVRRVLDELLDNAVKYSPNGGRITVVLSYENSRDPTMLRVDVSDEGIGIEPNDLPGIFQDFRQVDASDTRTFGGLGLGLAFVRRIVEAHRGTITTTSEPGLGTTFSFTLPVADTDGEVVEQP